MMKRLPWLEFRGQDTGALWAGQVLRLILTVQESHRGLRCLQERRFPGLRSHRQVGDSRLQDRSSSRKNTEQPKFAGKGRGIKVYAGDIGYKN